MVGRGLVSQEMDSKRGRYAGKLKLFTSIDAFAVTDRSGMRDKIGFDENAF